MGASHRVWVAGSSNMDLVATADRHPQAGETVAGRKLHFFPGGKGANQAVAAARLGAPTLLAARLGTDVFADQLESFLLQHGVDLTHTRRTPEAGTGTALIVVDAAAENTIVVVPGANHCWGATEFEDLQIEAGDILASQFEIPLMTIQSFFAHGKSKDAITILNPTPVQPLPQELASLVDILVLNESELAVFSGFLIQDLHHEDQLVTAARRIRAHHEQVVVITLGAAGVLTLEGSQLHRNAGLEVKTVDTTGAGDCFVGALAAELARGSNLARALDFANRAASLCVQAMGAGPAMPDRVAVESQRHT